MMDALGILATASVWAATLRIATPLIFGTLGTLLCERSGVLNLGIEGIMTVGAMVAWLTVYRTNDLWLGLFAAAFIGALFGLLHAFFTVSLGLSQHVTGLGITLFASSLAYYTFRLAVPMASSPPTIVPFQPWRVPLLSDIPFLGEAIFVQAAPTYVAIILTVIVGYVLVYTPLGMAIRMTGENPHAVEAHGLNPIRIRIWSVVAGSALMGMGGAFLTIAVFNSFFPTMVQGRGWICTALVVFASWKPWKALVGAILFGLFDAYQLRLQQVMAGAVPSQIFLMIPYLLSIAALVVSTRRARVPQALMQPFRRGEH
jgi:general nucleoside transport system permease protein